MIALPPALGHTRGALPDNCRILIGRLALGLYSILNLLLRTTERVVLLFDGLAHSKSAPQHRIREGPAHWQRSFEQRQLEERRGRTRRLTAKARARRATDRCVLVLRILKRGLLGPEVCLCTVECTRRRCVRRVGRCTRVGNATTRFSSAAAWDAGRRVAGHGGGSPLTLASAVWSRLWQSDGGCGCEHSVTTSCSRSTALLNSLLLVSI